MRVVFVSTIVILLVLAGFVALTPRAAAAPPVMGGFANTISWFHQPSGTQALLDMARAGTDPARMDAWLYYLLTPSDVASAKTNPAIGTVSTAGSWDDLFVNPIPVNQTLSPGVVNPFEKKTVREALNYLVDREFMSREITPGKGPMYGLWYRQAPDYGREAVFMSEVERKYQFNPTLGRQMITSALSADPNYSLVNGKWNWKGSPVVLKIIIRIEDERRNVGDYISDILEGLGFTVDRQYKTGGAAFPIAYYGPADTGAWMIYTEGIANLATVAWDDAAPWNYFVGDAFGDNVFTVSNYKPAAPLLNAANKLFYSNYSSLAERQSLVRTAVNESLKDSVRVFLVNNAVFAYSRRVSSFVYDLSGGTWSPFSLRTARFGLTSASGSCPSYPCGDLRIGQRNINFEGWQPWRINNLYDALAMAPGPMTDVGVYPSPHTGINIPVRSNFTVDSRSAPTTPGPIAVPATAQTWDSTTGGFKPVAAGTTAKSAVTFQFTFGKWHDGTTFDMTDVLYENALAFRRVLGDIHTADSDAAGPATQLFVSAFKGLEVTAPDTMTVYLDYWHPDPSTIASTASIFPATPWTASELGLSTVLSNGPCVLSSTTATVVGKEQLDMTKGLCLTAMQTNVAGYASAKHRPPGFSAATIPDVTVDAKWAALQSFNVTYGHYFVSNGPYFLNHVDATAEQYQMTRDPNYPFTADHWDRYLVPKIPVVTFGPAPSVLIGRAVTFNVGVTVLSTPYDDFTMTWLLVNPSTGTLVTQGSPTKVTPGVYTITLSAAQTAALAAGAYELRTITVGAEAAPPVFTTQSFIALPDVDTIIAEQNAKITVLTKELDRQAANQANVTAALQSQLNAAQTTATVGIGVGVAGIVAALVGIMLAVRKGRKPEERPTESEEI